MRFYSALIATLLFMLSACTGDKDIQGETPVYDTGMISFGMGLTTRAPVESDTSNKPLENITGVQVIRGTDGADIANASFNTRNTITATGSIAQQSGAMTLSPRQYFTLERENAHFMAFYPAATSFQAGKASFTINGSQDILVTKEPKTAVYNRDGANIDLVFDHLLSWIELKLIAEDEAAVQAFGNLTQASITVPNQVELTINANGTTSFAKKSPSTTMRLDFGSMTLSTTGITTNKGYMIYPDATDIPTISLAFEKRSPAESYNVTGLTLSPGVKTIIVATVSAHDISFQVEIAPWIPGNGTGEDIEIGN